VTDNAHQLPKIFAKETQLSAKPVRVTGHLKVSVSSDSPVVRSLAGTTLPTLSGNVVTTLKTGAQADLLASDSGGRTDPALAEWQIGVGRVVVWTPGLGAPWASGWLGESKLWNDAVRWTDRAVSPPTFTPAPVPGEPGHLQIDLAADGSAGLIVTGATGTLTNAAGHSFAVSFSAAGPGLLHADVSSLPPGVYGFSLAIQGSTAHAVTGEVALPYPPEYSPATTESSPLGALVAQTGGSDLRGGQESAIAASTHSLQRLLALLALVVFLAAVAGRMLPGLRRRARGRRAGAGRPRSAAGAGVVPGAGAAQETPARSSRPERAALSSSSSGSTDVDAGT
jgi:hypothetical protein